MSSLEGLSHPAPQPQLTAKPAPTMVGKEAFMEDRGGDYTAIEGRGMEKERAQA